MSDAGKVLSWNSIKPCLYFGALALLGAPGRAGDISLLQYALSVAILCVVFLAGTAVVRAMKEGVLRDAIRILTFVSALAILLFPFRGPDTPVWMLGLIFVALYVVVLCVFWVLKACGR